MRACRPVVRKWKICSICNRNGEEGFNRNARIVYELPRAMCPTTPPEKHEHLARPSNMWATIFEMWNQNNRMTK